MALEFVYSMEDIPNFVGYLYDNHYYLSRGAGLYKGKILSEIDANSALSSDLLFSGTKMYWVGNKKKSRIMQFSSCGKESHPRYLGKQGRSVGLFSQSGEIEDKSEALVLQKSVRAYFRKNGSFRPYNEIARMSCFFLRNYIELDERYALKPLPNNICHGAIRILCIKSQTEYYTNKINDVLHGFQGVDPDNLLVHKYWGEHQLTEICADFLCNRDCFLLSDLEQMIRTISDNNKAVIMNQKLHMLAKSVPNSSSCSSVDAPIISIQIDNPWECWLNREDEYSGKPINIWPR